jgi:hypothetical protein
MLLLSSPFFQNPNSNSKLVIRILPPYTELRRCIRAGLADSSIGPGLERGASSFLESLPGSLRNFGARFFILLEDAYD